MKKIFFLFATILAFALQGMAQNATTQDVSLGYNECYILKTGTSTDKPGSTTWTYTVKKLTDEKNKMSFLIKLDSVGTAKKTSIILQRKMFLNESFTSIDTVDWFMSSADTTISIIPTSVYNGIYHRVLIKPTTTGTSNATVNKLDIYFLKD